MYLQRKEREAREVAEDLRIRKGDLNTKREQVTMLKGTMAQQATAQIALTSQNTALQAQVSALRLRLMIIHGRSPTCRSRPKRRLRR